jgi:scyllo-inositol 2-dehydrogenase (NADP+)
VIVATPPTSHATIALEVLRAGRHVVLEKPMCLTAREADHLIAEAERSDRGIDGREATFRQSDLVAIRWPKFYVQGRPARSRAATGRW